MNQIENENVEPVTGDVLIPSERQHLFKNTDSLLDFVRVFKIVNFNVRSGVDGSGNVLYSLVYQPHEGSL